MPWYSVQRHGLVHAKLFKWYSAILTGIVLTVLYLRFHLFHFGRFGLAIPSLLRMLNQLTAFCKYVVAILEAGFWNMHTWQNFIKQIYFIKIIIGNMSRYFLIRNEKIYFIIGNIFLLVMFAIEIFTCNSNIERWLYCIFNYIFGYIAFILNPNT